MSWNDFFQSIEDDRKAIRREYDREFGLGRSSRQRPPQADNGTRQRYATGGNVRSERPHQSERIRKLAAKGRYGDTEIAEIGPSTARDLDYLIHGGRKEINPRTGLREYPTKKKFRSRSRSRSDSDENESDENNSSAPKRRLKNRVVEERRKEKERRKKIQPGLPPSGPGSYGPSGFQPYEKSKHPKGSKTMGPRNSSSDEDNDQISPSRPKERIRFDPIVLNPSSSSSSSTLPSYLKDEAMSFSSVQPPSPPPPPPGLGFGRGTGRGSTPTPPSSPPPPSPSHFTGKGTIYESGARPPQPKLEPGRDSDTDDDFRSGFGKDFLGRHVMHVPTRRAKVNDVGYMLDKAREKTKNRSLRGESFPRNTVTGLTKAEMRQWKQDLLSEPTQELSSAAGDNLIELSIPPTGRVMDIQPRKVRRQDTIQGPPYMDYIYPKGGAGILVASSGKAGEKMPHHIEKTVPKGNQEYIFKDEI